MERATVRLLRGGALVSALEGGVLGGPGLPWQRQRGLFLTGLGWEGGVARSLSRTRASLPPPGLSQDLLLRAGHDPDLFPGL